MRQKRRTPVVAEVLESRQMLSGISLDSGVLAIEGTNQSDEIVINESGGNVTVQFNGDTTTYSGVTEVVVDGGKGDDSLLVVSSTINNTLNGGKGNDLVSSTGQGSDTLIGGKGADTLYGIVGAPNVLVGGKGRDTLISRDGVDTTDGDREDTKIAFRGDPPGTVRDGVLYVGLGTGGQTIVNQSGNKLFVTINGVTSTFRANKIDAIAGVGSPGDDVFVNNSRVDAVYYGANGNDVLIGGRGDDVLKGGSGNDVVIDYFGNNFLTGDAGADVVLGHGFLLKDLDDLTQ